MIADGDLTLRVGDSRDVLKTLDDESVDCIVTSPPYWALRDYQTGIWDGGDPACDHMRPSTSMNRGFNERWGQGAGQRKQETKSDGQYPSACERCGAERVDRQIGLEDDPLEYVANLVEVFREARRVLSRHGTLWLNLGDTYASKPRGSDEGWESSRLTNPGGVQKSQGASLRRNGQRHRGKLAGLKEKDLCLIPARVALALQEDGWWLRSEVIWSKPNAMPASITDRPTVSHEHVWQLAKSKRYWFDREAVKEPANGSDEGRNIRTVWTIPLVPFGGEHFAAFPPELARRCIKAGCPLEVCLACGKPRERIVKKGAPVMAADTWSATGAASYDDEAGGYVPSESSSTLKHVVPTRTVGWTDCGCGAGFRPGIVMDPFMGAGTVAMVAREQGRRCVGIELNQRYAEIIAERTSQLSLLAG